MKKIQNYSIRELRQEYEKSKSENSSPSNISNISSTSKKKKIYFNKTLSRSDINKKIIERSINKEILNDNYLEFIIHEKIKYADIDKIIDYYSEKMNAKLKIFNTNEILIEKKKQELKQLNMAIYSELIKNINFSEVCGKDDLYEKEIQETKKEIKRKQHQIEIYKDIYNQSYKLNYKITKKLDNESIYSKIYEEQYQKYNEIYNNSLNKMQRQDGKLNELKRFFRKCKIINNSLISEKVQKINKLEYEIIMIKNNVVNFQETLEKLQEKNSEFQKIVDLNKNGYVVRKSEFNFIRKIYLREHYKMFEIFQIFKVDDFERILSEFKLIKKKYNQLSLRFHEFSKEIMKLSTEYKNNELELLKTKEKIDEKNKKVNKELKKFNSELIDLFNKQKNEFTDVNLQIYNECKNKENLINIWINYLINLIYKIINSMNNSVSKSPFKFLTKFNSKYNSFFNKDMTSVNLNCMEKIDDPKLLLFIISLIKDTRIFINQIVINVFYNIYSIINIEQNNLENINNINVLETSNNNKVDIIKLNSSIIQKEYNKQLKLSIQQLRLKKKIYSRNKDDILKKNEKSINSATMKKMNFSPSDYSIFSKASQLLNKRDLISPKDFFKDYIQYYNKSPIVDNDGFSGINKKLFIERYTNDLVSEKKNLEMKKIEKMKKREESTRLIKEKLEEREIVNFLKKKKNKKLLQIINRNVKKSEGEDEDEEKRQYEKRRMLVKKELEESKKPKVFRMKLSNPETDRIINRYEDIRTLEYNYIKNYSNFSVDPNMFNEYFYNIKKRFNQKVNKSSDINISNNSGRNNIKHKGLLKNYSVILPKIEKRDKINKKIKYLGVESPGNSINLKKFNINSLSP